MRVVSRRPFNDAKRRYPNQAAALDAAYKKLMVGSFSTPDELRQQFPSLDNFKYKENWWVIDIGGNNLRLLASVEFRHAAIFIKHISTHAEYDELCKKYRKGDL